jgi:hypothetical protein
MKTGNIGYVMAAFIGLGSLQACSDSTEESKYICVSQALERMREAYNTGKNDVITCGEYQFSAYRADVDELQALGENGAFYEEDPRLEEWENAIGG